MTNLGSLPGNINSVGNFGGNSKIGFGTSNKNYQSSSLGFGLNHGNNIGSNNNFDSFINDEKFNIIKQGKFYCEYKF